MSLSFQHEFASTGGSVWLNTAHQGRLPIRAGDVLGRRWIGSCTRKPWGLGPFTDLLNRLRQLLARLLGAEYAEVVLANSASYGLRLVANGLELLLAQDRDGDVEDREGMIVICDDPTESDWGDLLFARRVCKHVPSNAIVIAKGLRTIGVGAGQMSRVDAVRIAVEKAREHEHDLEGAAMASDAFFPFPDGPMIALEAGVRGIIQPGGSNRDSNVVAAANSADATMVFTSRRHFRH